MGVRIMSKNRLPGHSVAVSAGFAQYSIEKDFLEKPADHHFQWLTMGNVDFDLDPLEPQ